MDEYSPRVRATFVTQYVVAKRVSKEGGPSNILIQPPSWSPPLPGQRATIASRPHSSYGGGGERSEIAAVIYLLRSDFSSLRHPTPTFLASLLRFLLPNPPWFMTAPPPTLSGARILAAASRVYHSPRNEIYGGSLPNEPFPYFLHEPRVVHVRASRAAKILRIVGRNCSRGRWIFDYGEEQGGNVFGRIVVFSIVG